MKEDRKDHHTSFAVGWSDLVMVAILTAMLLGLPLLLLLLP
jgi:hypothetical protein